MMNDSVCSHSCKSSSSGLLRHKPNLITLKYYRIKKKKQSQYQTTMQHDIESTFAYVWKDERIPNMRGCIDFPLVTFFLVDDIRVIRRSLLCTDPTVNVKDY